VILMASDVVLMVAAKLALTMGIVVTASLMVERAGPFIGAMIATLPISAGPALVFLGLDHGPLFLAQSAVMALVTNGANAIFVLFYARLAQNHRLLVSLSGALLVWAVQIALAQSIDWTIPTAMLANISAYVIAFWGLRGPDVAPWTPKAEAALTDGVAFMLKVPPNAVTTGGVV
jgi:hypothetical protein